MNLNPHTDHNSIELHRPITSGGTTYTTITLRVVPFLTEQQIKRQSEVIERTPDGDWIKLPSQETYQQLMLVAGIDGLSNQSGKTLQADLARAAFSEAQDLRSVDAQRIIEQLHVLNILDLAEFGMISQDDLHAFLNGHYQTESTSDEHQEETDPQKRDPAGTAARPHALSNFDAKGGLFLEEDRGHEQG